MKKGVNFWSFADGTTVAEGIRLARKAGFDGVELAISKDGLTGLDSAGAAKEAKRIAQGEGVELPSLASSICWDYLMTSTLPSRRRIAKETIKRQVDTAAAIGANTILVLAGAVGVDFLNGNKDLMPYDQAYDVALESLVELAPYAENAGVCLGIENVWNKFLLSPLELRDFIDKIGSDYVGCYFDVGNVVLTGYPEQWISILGNRIRKVHFKDYRRNPGGFNSFVDLLSGDVDYPAVVKALKSVGYDDYCIAEMIPHYQHYPDQTVFSASATMDRILGMQ